MNVLHTLSRIKQSYQARIQPLTEQQILLVFNQSSMRKPQRTLPQIVSPIKYEPSSLIVSKLNKIQQFGLTKSKQFEFIFGQAFTEFEKDPNYLLRLAQFQNTLNEVTRDITNEDVKPIVEKVVGEYEEEDVNVVIEKVRRYRNNLTNIKRMVFQKNESIRKLLLKKQNLQKYLQQLNKVQTKITPIYKTLYSDYEIKIISQHIKGQHSQLKKYKFYNTLSSFLNNRIHEFEKNLRKVFIDNLQKIDQQQVKEMQIFLSSLNLFKKQSVPELLVFCFKQALCLEMESLLKQYNPDECDSISSILLKVEPELCVKCFLQFLLVAQSLIRNYETIKTIFQVKCSSNEIQFVMKQNLIIVYQSFINVLCKPIANQIFVFSVLHHFCINILKDEDLWCIIARQTAQSIKARLIEYKSSVIQDLNVELWNAVQFQYTTRLPTYQKILTLQLTYHGKIEWMMNKTLFNRLQSSLIPDSHILYSFFKFSKTFQKICLNVPYFDPLDANFLLSSALELLSHFIIEILRTLVDYPPITCSLYQKHRQWYNYKYTLQLLKEKQPKKQFKNIDDEDNVNLLCQSIKFIEELVRGHEWVLLYKHQNLTQANIEKLRDLENVLTQLPSLTHHCFIKSKLKSIDLDIIGHNQWINLPQTQYNFLIDSFDLQFLNNKQSKFQFSRQFQYLFIDKICSQNSKHQDFQKMIQQFSVLKRKLQSKGFKSAKQVQRFLVVCISGEEDSILKLLYEKKLIYSQRSIEFLYDMIKNKNSQKLGFWDVLTTICEGDPTDNY